MTVDSWAHAVRVILDCNFPTTHYIRHVIDSNLDDEKLVWYKAKVESVSVIKSSIRNRSVQDASLVFMNDISKHLDQRYSSTRIPFINFSSAFNTIQPHILLKKLLKMGYNSNLLIWISSF